MKTLTLSKEFVKRCEDYEISNINAFVFMLTRHFVPVQKLSDAMKNSNDQCSFNLRTNELQVNDPFNLFKTCNIEKIFEIKFKA
jgi:hypothetical protein